MASTLPGARPRRPSLLGIPPSLASGLADALAALRPLARQSNAPLVSAALRMALSQRRPASSLILHSDRGSQFASAAYRQLLAQHGLVASMSRPGNCYDNAFIESFWSTLKYELAWGCPDSSDSAAQATGSRLLYI